MRTQTKLLITGIISGILLAALIDGITISLTGSGNSRKDVSDVDQVLSPLFMPSSNMQAEEMLIIKLADTQQAKEVRTAIEKRLQTQKNAFDGYAPQQFDLCSRAIIDVRGNYVLFVIHENAAEIDAQFRRAL